MRREGDMGRNFPPWLSSRHLGRCLGCHVLAPKHKKNIWYWVQWQIGHYSQASYWIKLDPSGTKTWRRACQRCFAGRVPCIAGKPAQCIFTATREWSHARVQQCAWLLAQGHSAFIPVCRGASPGQNIWVDRHGERAARAYNGSGSGTTPPCKNSSDLNQFQERPLAKVRWTCPPRGDASAVFTCIGALGTPSRIFLLK